MGMKYLNMQMRNLLCTFRDDRKEILTEIVHFSAKTR